MQERERAVAEVAADAHTARRQQLHVIERVPSLDSQAVHPPRRHVCNHAPICQNAPKTFRRLIDSRMTAGVLTREVLQEQPRVVAELVRGSERQHRLRSLSDQSSGGTQWISDRSSAGMDRGAHTTPAFASQLLSVRPSDPLKPPIHLHHFVVHTQNQRWI